MLNELKVKLLTKLHFASANEAEMGHDLRHLIQNHTRIELM